MGVAVACAKAAYQGQHVDVPPIVALRGNALPLKTTGPDFVAATGAVAAKL